MPDDMDRAQEREQEMRQDALAEQSRRTQMMQAGDSAEFCVLFETEIPQGRRMAVPGVQTCIECQTDLEKAVA